MKVLIFFSVILLIFTGCEKKYKYSTLDQNLTFASDEARKLSKIHQKYWEMYSQKKFSNTYPYELAYMRFLHSLEWYKLFLASNKANYTVIQEKIVIDGNSAVVKTKHIYDNNKTAVFYDPWYNVNGTWQHEFKDSILPDASSMEIRNNF